MKNIISTLIVYGILATAFVIWSPFPAEAYRLELLMYLYLLLAAGLVSIGYFRFGGRYVLPKWKRNGKIIAYMLLSYIALVGLGHWALIYIIGSQGIGFIFHIYACRKYDIDWRTIEPRERYIALMEKWGRGDFTPL